MQYSSRYKNDLWGHVHVVAQYDIIFLLALPCFFKYPKVYLKCLVGTRKPYWKGRLCTLDLLVTNYFRSAPFYIEKSIYFFTNEEVNCTKPSTSVRVIMFCLHSGITNLSLYKHCNSTNVTNKAGCMCHYSVFLS